MTSLRFSQAAVLALALTFTVSGCTPGGSEPKNSVNGSSAAASDDGTTTPSPTPTVMTDKEAAALYLSSACAANVPSKAFNDAWANPNPDLATIKQTAATTRDAVAATAKTLDEGRWPAAVKDDIAIVRDSDFAQASILGGIASSSTLEQAFQNQFPATDPASAASQRIRSRLGLPADPYQGC